LGGGGGGGAASALAAAMAKMRRRSDARVVAVVVRIIEAFLRWCLCWIGAAAAIALCARVWRERSQLSGEEERALCS
jgi:hypothetical protein